MKSTIPDSSETSLEACLDDMRQAVSAGDPIRAEATGKDYLARDPAAWRVAKGLAVALMLQGKFGAAKPVLEPVLRLAPNDIDVRANLAKVQFEAREYSAAEATYRALVDLDSENRDHLTGLALTLKSMRRFADSAARHEGIIARWGGDADILASLVDVRRNEGELAEAVRLCDQALANSPRHAGALLNTAHALLMMGRSDEAFGFAERAAREAPKHPRFQMNYGMYLLRMGRYAEGWAGYEFRGGADRSLRIPRWAGQSLAGNNIFVWLEQGLGDIFQFARFLPSLKWLGARVYLEDSFGVAALVSSSGGVDEIVPPAEIPDDADYHISLMSLSGALAITVDTIPGQTPYLSPDPELSREWAARLSALGDGLVVGLNWQGNPDQVNDHFRSPPLAALEALIRRRDITIVNLHRGTGRPALDEVKERWNIVDFGDDALDGPKGRLFGTAAIISNLDLVISSCTSTAHLAAALGAPTWVMLSTMADWRWLLDRDDSPWYPTVKLFRQRRFGDWNGVVSEICGALDRGI